MSTAPVADQQRLLEVQALDTRAQQLAHATRTHPGHARVAELDARLAESEQAVAVSRTAVGDLRRELAKAEQDVEQVRTRAARDRARMESGAASAKDVQALASELESLARRTEVLEEAELEVMERMEAEETRLAGLVAAHESVAAERESAGRELASALTVLQEEAGQVATDRGPAVQGIDQGLLALYERLRDQLGGLAVAPLRGRTCGGCRLELNPSDLARITAAPPEQVVRCEECGRILVRSTDR